MTTITHVPYEQALSLVDEMRILADNDDTDLTEYRATLPAEIIGMLHMLNQFSVAGYRTKEVRSLGRDAHERSIYALLGQEWVFDTLYEASCSGEFYKDGAEIDEAFAPFEGTGVPVDLVVAFILIFSAVYASTTIEDLLGVGEPHT